MADTAGLLAQWDERLQALARLPQEAREAQRKQFAQTAVRAWAGKNGLNIPSTEKWFLDTTAQGPVRAPFPKTAVAATAGVGTLLEPLANVAGMRRTADVLRGQQETAVERARQAGTSELGIGAAEMGGRLAAMLPAYAKAASVASSAARALPKVLPGAFGMASGKAAVLARELPQIESRVAVATKALDTVGVGFVEGAHAAAMAKDGDRVGHAVEGFLEGSAFMTGFHALGAGARGLRSALRSRHGFSEAQAGAVDDVARFGEQGVDAGTLAQARAAVAQSGPDAVSKTIFGYTEQVALAADRAGFPRRAPVVEPVGSKLRVNMRGPNGESYVAGDTRGVDASQAEFLLKRIGQYLKQGYHVEGVDGDRQAIHAFYSALEKIHEPVYQRLLPPAPAVKGTKAARPGPVAVPKPAAAPEGTQLPVFLAGGSVRIPGIDGKPVVFPHVDAALKDVRSRADGAGKRFLERELARDRRGNGKGVLARLRHEATVAGYEFEALPGGGYAFMRAGVEPGAGANRKVFKGLDDAVAFADENLREPLTTPELVDMAMVNPAFRRVAVNHLAGDVLPPSGGRPVTTVPGGPEVFELPKSGVSVASFYTRPFYAWLNSWATKNARPDVYKVFRDADGAQLQRDLFAIPYAKVVREVFRGVKPSRRHDLYRYLEAADSDRAGLAGQLKLSGDEIGRMDRVRREFFDPLFQEFGFDGRQFIRNYAPRVRRDLEAAGAARNPDVYLARGGDGVPGADFWAEQARTGALDVYDTDLQRVMLASQPCRGALGWSSERWGMTTLQSSASWTSQPTDLHRSGCGSQWSRLCHAEEQPKESSHSMRTSLTVSCWGVASGPSPRHSSPP